MRLFNRYNALIAEITCTGNDVHEPGNPSDRLIEVLNRENLDFAVEECLVSRKEILKHPAWEKWRETRVEYIPEEVTVFIFLSSVKDRPRLDAVCREWLEKNRKLFRGGWDCLSPAV